MKKLLTVLLACGWLTANALDPTPFEFWALDQAGRPLTNRVTIEAWPNTNLIVGVGTNLVTGLGGDYYPDTNGYVFGYLLPNNYRLQIQGFPRGIQFGMVSSASTQNVAQLAGVPVVTFQNFTLAQFSDVGTAAYSNQAAFLPHTRTNWAWQDVTNLQSAQMPVSVLTNAGTMAYSNGTHFLLHSRTNWAWQDVTNLQSAQVPVSVLTNADNMTYSNATTFINFMLTNLTGAIWYGTIFSTNFNGIIGALSNGVLWSSKFHAPVFTNGVNYGTALSSVGTGVNSEQFGTGSTATNTSSLAVGRTAISGGNSSTAVGINARATGGSSVAVGTAAVASGNDTLALGATATATAGGGIAIGSASEAGYTNSIGLGQGAKPDYAYQIKIGGALHETRIGGNFSVAGNQTNGVVYGTSSFSDMAWRRYAITTLVNGDGNEINVGTNTFIQVSGPTAAFGIMGINGQPNRNGHFVILLNKTGYDMKIQHEAAGEPTASYRIVTMTGTNRTTTGNGAAMLIYSTSESRWQLISFEP